MEKNSASTNHLRALFFDKSQEGFLIFDKNLNILDVSKSVLKSLHLRKAQVIGKHVSDISPGIKDTERYAMYQEVIRSGKPIIIDDVVPHPSVGNSYNRVHAFKLGAGLGIVSSNITDLKEAMEEINSYTYRISHDMRSPLASILGLIEVAKTEATDQESSSYYFHLIKQQAERMDSVLKELMKLVRITEGEKQLHWIDFQQLIEQVTQSCIPMSGYNEVRIEKHISVKQSFYSVRSLVVSLFQNLINNAIKYRKQGIDHAFVKIAVVDYGDGVMVTIEDNGMGINIKKQEDVFKMFFRATDRASGAGLGLHIVKQCIKQLGGQISLSSSPDGTTFTLLLPNKSGKAPDTLSERPFLPE